MMEQFITFVPHFCLKGLLVHRCVQKPTEVEQNPCTKITLDVETIDLREIGNGESS
jgi:hypothetical protein